MSILDTVRARLSITTRDALARIARTFLWAFLGVLIPGSLGWLNDLTAWAKSQGQTPFPDAHSLAFVGVAAISAGCIAVLNALVLVVENVTGVGILRRVPAPPDTRRWNERGYVSPWGLLVVVVLVVLLVVLLR